MRTETVEKLSPITILKLLVIGQLVTLFMLAMVLFLMVIVGILPLGPGNEASMSLSFSALGIYIGATIITLPFWIFCLWLSMVPGLWLWSKFRTISISYTPISDE